ncbi:uncharacterized protein LOC131994080 [Stomoxys calcitrans]|uniref:uncharacterized protein LOC131994080 n=1 Tax=Stomoxys calcitrans TaxID=35570 RepID=UPI0027E2558B|nr:uncharacterized protein LOC131994080 [Stomoxys calcitrans]
MLVKTFALLAILSILCTSSCRNIDCKEGTRIRCKEKIQNQCYFERQRSCFRHFATNCHMELMACKSGREYEIWPEKFCKSVQFLCQEEIDEYHWPPNDLYQQIVHIRDNATNQFELMLRTDGQQ